MRRTWLAAAITSLTVVAALTGCGSRPAAPSQSAPAKQAPAHPSHAIVVFAAASLKSAFTTIGEQFKIDNPGTTIDFSFAGSAELATQLTQGANADVFASADTAQMDNVAKAGLLAGNPVTFASNTLVIVTAPGNPRQVQDFADLNKPGLSVVVCQRPVPCGAAAHRVEDSTGVHLNPVSEEPSVTDVLNKVTTGEADAGLVYVTDARNAAGKVATVNFPEASGARNVYPIAVLKAAAQPGAAQKLVDAVTGATGQQVLEQAGFAKP
jgi:molybdate transport system substrate-binding protein